jgi:DNA repair exonuclease SbcCD ATPase subunit
MNISKLSITNFLTIGFATLELDSRGLLLIQGCNADDPSAKSNGAGKSSIVDALCWSLFGVTARGVATDAVVNITAKKNCRVKVEIEDGANRYFITRYRKDSTHKNQVFVEQQTASGLVDMSKGTDKETQEVINKIIGCSLDVFIASVYCGQEKMPDLPGMTDKQLKLLIEEAAGIEVLSEAYSVARSRSLTAKSALDANMATTRATEASLLATQGQLESGEESSALFESERKARAKTELAKTVPVKAEIDALIGTLVDTDELEKEIKELDEKLKKQKSEQTELIALNKTTTAAENLATRQRTIAQQAKSAVSAAEASLASIESRIGTPCSECGKEYHADDMRDARLAQDMVVGKRKIEFRDALAGFKNAQDAYKTAFDASTAFEAAMTDFTAVNARLRVLRDWVSDIRLTESKIESKRKEIASFSESAKLKLNEANPWEKLVSSRREDVAKLEKRIVELEAQGRLLEVSNEMLANAVKVFGPAGVRAHILDTVTPFLNDRTRDYLGALSDGNIHAEWSTLSKTAKGDLKEKFNIEVVNDKGADSFAGLSGGEKRKVRLATVMALQDMVASRATKPISLFLCDEIDHALDESGLERLMVVLERKARERGTVMVISHQSMSDWIDNVITVTKSGGLATVSGATERGF